MAVTQLNVPLEEQVAEAFRRAVLAEGVRRGKRVSQREALTEAIGLWVSRHADAVVPRNGRVPRTVDDMLNEDDKDE